MTASEIRYSAPSQHEQYYLNKVGMWNSAETMELKRKHAIKASNSVVRTIDQQIENSSNSALPPIDPKMVKLRQAGIEYLFRHGFSCPPRDLWHEMNLVRNISQRLMIPEGSYKSVVKVMEKCLKIDNGELCSIKRKKR
jgi:hypothetical protein